MYSKNGQVKHVSLGKTKADGFILHGHVCTVVGYKEYEQFPVTQKKKT